MSKLSKRVDKLFLKTHVFITKKDLLLIKDYYKALLDENNVKPEDFQKEYDELWRLEEECSKDTSIDFDEKQQVITKDNHLIIWGFFLQIAMKDYEMYPNGEWFLKKEVHSALIVIKEAKEYFSNK